MSEFHCQRTVAKPRKVKRCGWCNQICPVGEPRIAVSGVFDAGWNSYVLHAECDAAISRAYEVRDFEPYEGWEFGEYQRGKAPSEEEAAK